MDLFVGQVLKTGELKGLSMNVSLKIFIPSFGMVERFTWQRNVPDLQKYPDLFETFLPKAGGLVQYILMQGRQRIKDIVSTLTDTEDIDHNLRRKTLNNTLKNLLKHQYLRTVNWWNLMPADDLVAKITMEEEKKVRGGGSTSASMATKAIKEAGKATVSRLKALKRDDKAMETLKRKASEQISVESYRNSKRRRVEEGEDDEEELRLDLDVCPIDTVPDCRMTPI
jgi:hypothetical protein